MHHFENAVKTKKERVELLMRPVRINSKRLIGLTRGMLIRMSEPHWPKHLQALWIERNDLRELPPVLDEISRSLGLDGRIFWIGDEGELSRLIGNVDATGLAVVIGGDRLSNGMQRTLLQAELKVRYRFVFLTEQDPGQLIGTSHWRDDFRKNVLTIRWPRITERRGDYKALFRTGIEHAALDLGLAYVPGVENAVYHELMREPWTTLGGACAILDFGAKCLQIAFAYQNGDPGKIMHEHARVALDRPIEVTHAQAHDSLPPTANGLPI